MQNWNPHEYQMSALHGMLANPGYGMFAEPGLGKTSTTLAAYLTLKQHNAAKGLLVVAPLRPVYKVWPAEVAKWSDFKSLSWTILHGPHKETRLKAVNRTDLYFINYEGLAWLEGQLKGMKDWPFDVLCLDESTKIKNTSTQRFKVCKRLRDRFSRVWELTGTPAPNGLENLFGQVYMLDGGERLGRFVTHFRREYFTEYPQRGGYSLWEPRKDSQQRIQAKIADITLALRAEDYLKMPRKIENRIEVDLPASALKVYKGVEDDFFAELASGAVTAANAAAKSMKLRQIASGGVYGTEGEQGVHSAKMEALADLIEEQEGQPLLVAVGYKHEVEAIRKHLKDDSIPYLGGGVSMNESNKIIDDWNAGRIPVLLAHPTSVAHGLNLQAGGNAVVWYTLTWNLEEFDQFNARVYRQGQTKPVTFHYIVAVDTIDDSVLTALRDKDRTQKALMSALKEKIK
jgi:SNF2 family DNA or RNA helicase